MPSLSTYLCPNYITYKEPAISKPSPTINGRFDPKNRPVQKKKHKVIKQVYRVKKDGRLNKNSDLTHVKEKPTVEEVLASSIDQIDPIAILHQIIWLNNDQVRLGGKTRRKKLTAN